MTDANVRPAAPRSERTRHLENLTRNLVNYFSAVGARRGHVFTMRDLNLQVMMNTFAPEERALLDVVLTSFVHDGSLRRLSETSYALTDEGLRRVRRDRGGLRDVGEALPINSPGAHPNA